MDFSEIINELGEDRQQYFNAVSPPIIQTSNFVFKKIDDLTAAFEDESDCYLRGGYLYSRGLNPTVDILRKKLAALDGAEDCLVFNSGAAAIFAAILANVKSGDHIVSVRSPYTWVQRMLDVVLPRFKVTSTYIDGTRIKNWMEATKENTTFYYLESPNSWDYAIQPIEEVAKLAKSKGIVSLIDNSYCTPLYQQPHLMGMDMVMQTATKYVGGHSDTLGGILCGSHQMMKKIFNSEYLNIGSGIQPFNAWLLIRGLRTMSVRLKQITQTTATVVQHLQQHPKIEHVIFPLDPSFPQYGLAVKQMKGACGLITVTLKSDKRDSIVRFCESLQHFLIAVSWGGHESLVIPKCAAIPLHEFNPGYPAHKYIRLYIGLEDPAYLIDDLDQALALVD